MLDEELEAEEAAMAAEEEAELIRAQARICISAHTQILTNWGEHIYLSNRHSIDSSSHKYSHNKLLFLALVFRHHESVLAP